MPPPPGSLSFFPATRALPPLTSQTQPLVPSPPCWPSVYSPFFPRQKDLRLPQVPPLQLGAVGPISSSEVPASSESHHCRGRSCSQQHLKPTNLPLPDIFSPHSCTRTLFSQAPRSLPPESQLGLLSLCTFPPPEGPPLVKAGRSSWAPLFSGPREGRALGPLRALGTAMSSGAGAAREGGDREVAHRFGPRAWGSPRSSGARGEAGGLAIGLPSGPADLPGPQRVGVCPAAQRCLGKDKEPTLCSGGHLRAACTARALAAPQPGPAKWLQTGG